MTLYSNVIKEIMEVTNKRLNKKSDKETQSPVTKVFKEIMQREKDPEKANLLKEKQDNRKRKHHVSSRSKTEHVRKPCDSSSTERAKRNLQYNIYGQSNNMNAERRTDSFPFHEDKKDSWWFWGGDKQKPTEDTHSCVSCVFRRVVTSEFACMACLGVLALLMVTTALFLVFNTSPSIEKLETEKSSEVGPKSLRKGLAMIGNQKGIEDVAGFDEGYSDRKAWDERLPRHLSDIPVSSGNDFEDNKFREYKFLDGANSNLNNDLSNILDTDKINDGFSSQRLKSFYKKLIETDAQIKNLKKSFNDFPGVYSNDLYEIDRVKRSPKNKVFKKTNDKTIKEDVAQNVDFKMFNLFYPPYTAFNVTEKKRKRRFDNNTSPDLSIKSKRDLIKCDKQKDTQTEARRLKMKQLREDKGKMTNKRDYFNTSTDLSGLLKSRLQKMNKKENVVKHANEVNNNHFDSHISKWNSRSLKSIDLNVETKESNVADNFNAPKHNKLEYNNATRTDIIDFFAMMVDWPRLATNLIRIDKTKSVGNETKSVAQINKSMEVFYPKDSNSDKIGHISRGLLSVSEAIEDVLKHNNTLMETKTRSNTSKTGLNIMETKTVTTHKAVTEVNNTGTQIKNTDLTNVNNDTMGNKSVVKRNALEDSNIIFWNDMYDEEYEVQNDPIEEPVPDKNSNKGVDFVKKANDWIKDKFQIFSKNIRTRVKSKGNEKSHSDRPLRHARRDIHPKLINYRKFPKRNVNEKHVVGDTNNQLSFVALTAKMKNVCKEAAKAVQQTKRIRQDETGDAVATSLMQQLVRLMTDLIDFQVDQKTCFRLPPDLQEFLLWLHTPQQTAAKTTTRSGFKEDFGFDKQPEEIQDLFPTSSSEKDSPGPFLDTRSECLGTLNAVEDLLQQYDGMSDEDKSKMTGVKEYLENQLQYLHKQLTLISNPYEDISRYRRDAKGKREDSKSKTKNHRCKRVFLRNFTKKHTKTTSSIYDGHTANEVKKDNKDGKKNKVIKKEENKYKEVAKSNVEKRNLRDVYYRALEAARQSTTVKTSHEIENDGFDTVHIVRIDS